MLILGVEDSFLWIYVEWRQVVCVLKKRKFSAKYVHEIHIVVKILLINASS